MKTSIRAERRANRDRMKARARRLYPGQNAVKFADNLTACSGPCCGNPRRWNGDKTMQELKFDEKSRSSGQWTVNSEQ